MSSRSKKMRRRPDRASAGTTPVNGDEGGGNATEVDAVVPTLKILDDGRLIPDSSLPMAAVKVPQVSSCTRKDLSMKLVEQDRGWRYDGDLGHDVKLTAGYPDARVGSDQLTGSSYYAMIYDSKRKLLLYRKLPTLEAHITTHDIEEARGRRRNTDLEQEAEDRERQRNQSLFEFAGEKAKKGIIERAKADLLMKQLEENSSGTNLKSATYLATPDSPTKPFSSSPLPPFHAEKTVPHEVYVWKELVTPDVEPALKKIGEQILAVRRKTDIGGIFGDGCPQVAIDMIHTFMNRAKKRRADLTSLVYMSFLIQMVQQKYVKSFFGQLFATFPDVGKNFKKIFTTKEGTIP